MCSSSSLCVLCAALELDSSNNSIKESMKVRSFTPLSQLLSMLAAGRIWLRLRLALGMLFCTMDSFGWPRACVCCTLSKRPCAGHAVCLFAGCEEEARCEAWGGGEGAGAKGAESAAAAASWTGGQRWLSVLYEGTCLPPTCLQEGLCSLVLPHALVLLLTLATNASSAACSCAPAFAVCVLCLLRSGFILWI